MLLEAAIAGDVERVRDLIAAGTPLELRDAAKRTALLLATRANQVEVARLLIDAGADVNAKDNIRDTPFLYAAAEGRNEILKLILASGRANLRDTNRYGGVALIPAAHHAHPETVRILLATEIDIDHVNNLGWTALIEAVILGDGGPVFQEIVGLLVDAGAKQHPRPRRHNAARRMPASAAMRKSRRGSRPARAADCAEAQLARPGLLLTEIAPLLRYMARQPFILHNRRDNEPGNCTGGFAMRRKASSRLFVPVVLAVTLLAPFGIAAAEEGGTLGDLFRELLGGGEPNLLRRLRRSRRTGSPGPAAIDSKRVPFGRAEMELSFAPLVKTTAPAVVNVYASQKVAARSPFAGDPFFEQFFGGQQMPPRVQQSLGSGVLVDPSGHRRHQFPRHPRCRRRSKSRRRTAASSKSKTLLKDESLDLAVLKIDAPQPFPVVGIGNSDALEVGDLVLAIGNPFGVGQTTTSGIVSALARSHTSASPISASSSRPTRRSIRAIPAAR